MTISANEIEQALKSNNRDELARIYALLKGKPLDRNCGDCIKDARTVLQIALNEIERESAPLVLILVNPSEEVLFQNQDSYFSEVVTAASHTDALNKTRDNAVNVISDNCFFDETINNARGIKPYQAYALDCYNWNGNGHATLYSGLPGTWILSGKPKKPVTDLSQLKAVGYTVSNPTDTIHAIRHVQQKKVDLYQILYKDGIPKDPDCIHEDTRHIPESTVSPIYENYHILRLYPTFDWSADYYGVGSWRMYEKTGLRKKDLDDFINAHPGANACVYYSSGGLRQAPVDIAAAVRRIIELKVFKAPDIEKRWVNVYANYWLADKKTWDRYIPVLKQLIELTKTDPKLKALCAKTYRFRNQDFPLTCFVLEYAFGLFLADNPDIKYKQIPPKNGNDLHTVYQRHKAPAGFGDKGTLHHYIDTYNSLLIGYKDKPCTLLEIGVCQGHSLRMWREFLPQARVIGVDLNQPKLPVPGCEFHICDQTDGDKLNKIFSDVEFDVIIDDGSHILEHQIATFKALFPKLKKGGLYIIEDVGGVSHEVDKEIQILKRELGDCDVYDTRAISKRYDDILMVWVKT